MWKAILIVMGFSVSAMAYESVDYTCLNNCAAQGYQQAFCKSECTFEVGGANTGQRLDRTCLQNCSRKGHKLNFCKERCSY